jgi:hypothetical protein
MAFTKGKSPPFGAWRTEAALWRTLAASRRRKALALATASFQSSFLVTRLSATPPSTLPSIVSCSSSSMNFPL